MQPESHCHLDLHADAAASSIADVLRIGGRELVPIASDLDAQPGQRLADRQFQCLIESAEEHSLIIAAATVNREHVIAHGQERQAARFIKEGWPGIMKNSPKAAYSSELKSES
jgi:hypothetical protein